MQSLERLTQDIVHTKHFWKISIISVEAIHREIKVLK